MLEILAWASTAPVFMFVGVWLASLVRLLWSPKKVARGEAR